MFQGDYFKVLPFLLFWCRSVCSQRVGGRLVSVIATLSLLATYNKGPGAATRTRGVSCAIRRFTSLRVLHCHMPNFRSLSLGRGRLICCLARTTLRNESVLFSRGNGCGLAVHQVLRTICANCGKSGGAPSFGTVRICLGQM